jgi:hypothetical protein
VLLVVWVGVVLGHAQALAQPSAATGSSTLSARGKAKANEPLGPLAVRIAVAVDGDTAVVDDAWIATELSEANRLLGPHGIRVQAIERRALGASFVALETAEDRDRLASGVGRGAIDVFVVRSLRDVDDPRRMILGVRWRLRRDTDKDYVILSSIASPTTLAHELGHYLGLGHSPVVDNVMSYRRSDPGAVSFEPRQGAKMLATAHRLVRSKRLGTITTAPQAAQPDTLGQ